MSSQNEITVGQRIKDLFVYLLALRITESERLSYADDPFNVYNDEVSNERPLRVAAVIALLFHILLMIVSLPFFGQTEIKQAEVTLLKNLALPAALAGGSPPQPVAPEPKPKPVAPKPKPVVVPIPDPTPAEPEPIIKETTEIVPQVVDELTADLNIGDISAPTNRGRGRGNQGTGEGPSDGSGSDAGAGNGPYSLGSGVTEPVLLQKTTPSYTDDAIRAKVQGIVLLEAVIGKDGSVSQFRVLRGLGYGLEEKAIREIATNWKFLPARLPSGEAVDFRATIEVSFNLR